MNLIFIKIKEYTFFNFNIVWPLLGLVSPSAGPLPGDRDASDNLLINSSSSCGSQRRNKDPAVRGKGATVNYQSGL